MSIRIAREGRTLVAQLEGTPSDADVIALAQHIKDANHEHAQPCSLLVLVSPGVGRPDEAAKRSMRSQRALLRAPREIHVVIQGRSLLARVGLMAARASSLMRSHDRPAMHFYRNESDARRALREAGAL